MTRFVLAMAGVLALILGAGCVTSHSTGKATYALRRHLNAWETTVAVPITKAHKATVAGLADLEIKPLTSRVDKLTGLVDGSLADATSFEVRLEATGDAQTRIRIRCGMLGDREQAVHVFRAIEARL